MDQEQFPVGVKLTLEISPDLFFVFGSNRKGIHGKGAALEAARNWGAIRGKGDGQVGHSYAIPTKHDPYSELPLALRTVESLTRVFLEHARTHADRLFIVTRFGCGEAGYRDQDIAPFVGGAPVNCILPVQWVKWDQKPLFRFYHDEGFWVGNPYWKGNTNDVPNDL